HNENRPPTSGPRCSRACGEGQHQTDGDEREHGDEGHAVHRPPPACEAAASCAREGHWAASLFLERSATSARNTSPRCSKSRNWSNDAQAGDKRTTGASAEERAASRAAAATAASIV